MYIEYNPNPKRKLIDDCVVRAISIVMHKSWQQVYVELFAAGLKHCDWPNKNYIWGEYLEENGFKQNLIPNSCPKCYTVRDFCRDYHAGTYLLAIGDHVVAVIDGDYYDIWDSGDEVPVYFWEEM